VITFYIMGWRKYYVGRFMRIVYVGKERKNERTNFKKSGRAITQAKALTYLRPS
jgi:hypothetical protein